MLLHVISCGVLLYLIAVLDIHDIVPQLALIVGLLLWHSINELVLIHCILVQLDLLLMYLLAVLDVHDIEPQLDYRSQLPHHSLLRTLGHLLASIVQVVLSTQYQPH